MNETLEMPLKNGAETDKKQVWLFVCTGNTCRSPMAEAVANHLFEKRGIRAESAGLAVPFPSPIAPNAVSALKERGIEPTEENDYRRHTARQLNEEILRRADRIYPLSSSHAMGILTSYPEFAQKICSLGASIPDPYGGDAEVYRAALDAIYSAVEGLLP